VVSVADLDRAIRGAVETIIAKRGKSGLWADFRTEAGHSDEWVSGFVLCALACSGTKYSILLPTIEALLTRQRRSGGWSYNRSIPADCDSTGWVLMAMAMVPNLAPSVADRAIGFVKAHQDGSTGGFATYSAGDGIERVIGTPPQAVIDGWFHAQPCVTGLALRSLLCHGEPLLSPTVRSAGDYLLRQRNQSMVWPSYWWKGYTYSTYLCLEALSLAGRLGMDAAQPTLRYILAQQHEDGGWVDSPADDSEVFATAFCLMSLLLFPERDAMPAAARGAGYLLRQQQADGSWPTAPILRIPSPLAERLPGMTTASWRAIERGTNVTIEDLDSIYTTSAAIWALSAFRAMVRAQSPDKSGEWCGDPALAGWTHHS
jgi:squalene cyclase